MGSIKNVLTALAAATPSRSITIADAVAAICAMSPQVMKVKVRTATFIAIGSERAKDRRQAVSLTPILSTPGKTITESPTWLLSGASLYIENGELAAPGADLRPMNIGSQTALM